MNKTVLMSLLCLALALVMTGCYTLSKVNFGNGSATAIKVKSSQTGQEINIPPGEFRELPHATGDLLVTTQTNGQFTFSEVEPPVLDNYLAKRKNIFGPGSITLKVRLETDMQLYVVMPGEKTSNGKTQQPNGYPKTGKKLDN